MTVHDSGKLGIRVILSEAKNQPKMEVLAINKLPEGIDASPAIVGREMFLRGRQHLYCLAKPVTPRAP